MRKENKSWTRIEYEIACRHYRFTGKPDKGALCSIQESIWDAADCSYQNKGYREMGWSGEMRRHRFHAILARVYALRGEIPF